MAALYVTELRTYLILEIEVRNAYPKKMVLVKREIKAALSMGSSQKKDAAMSSVSFELCPLLSASHFTCSFSHLVTLRPPAVLVYLQCFFHFHSHYSLEGAECNTLQRKVITTVA